MELLDLKSNIEADIKKYRCLLDQAIANEKIPVPEGFVSLRNSQLIPAIIKELERVLNEVHNADRS